MWLLLMVAVVALGAMPILLVLPFVADRATELHRESQARPCQAAVPQQIASGERVTHVHHSWLALQWSMCGVTLVGMSNRGRTAVGQRDWQTHSSSGRQTDNQNQQLHIHMHIYTHVFKCYTHWYEMEGCVYGVRVCNTGECVADTEGQAVPSCTSIDPSASRH